MVDRVVPFLLENLSRLLVDEVKLLDGVEDKVTSLANELKFVDIFLKSSAGKRNNEVVKEVVRQIRDVAYKAEDVVYTYVVNATKYRRRNIVGKLFHGKEHVMMLHDVNAEIDKIKGTIEEIYKNKEKYDIVEGDFRSGDTEESLRKKRECVEEEDVVGLVHDSNVVIKHLTATDSGLNVVSIIGMGGLGKTTLARMIYNNNHIKQVFPCRAWGYVSNNYRVRELLLRLLKCLTPSTSEYQDLSEDDLKEKVRECLTGKKYLVVLDDTWKPQTWNELMNVFPDDHQSGSRILFTSRRHDVAPHTFFYELPLLDKDDSWKLFSKKAFPRGECPSGLEDLGKSIAEGCGGVPLAIVVLAGIVASRKDESQRERFLRSIKNHVNWGLRLTQENKEVNEVNDILKLSYDSLPRRLKPCFLYFGIYPEDYEIPVRQLIQLWIAEGFIQPPQEIGISNAPELEELADCYLDELVDRSLVQVASRRSDGGVKSCCIHDLLRDLCISESKADKFLEVCIESNVDSLSNPRRLSMHSRPDFYLSSIKGNKSWTRSLFFFYEREKYPDDILKDFKLVRVLNFGKVYLESHPSDLKSLIHLRYLRIDVVVDVKTILASICSLWNLQTLDLRDRYIESVPSGVWKLKRLRHLYMGGNAILPTDISGVDNKTLRNLQTLCWVALDPRTASLVENNSFPNLKKLGLRYHEYQRDEFPAHEQLRILHRLSNLRTLKIKGTSDLPIDLNVFPPNLTKITLTEFTSFDSRTMNTLGCLPNLQILKLSKGRITDSLNCAAKGFPQLQVFHMVYIRVKSWRLDKGTMPRLRRLLIGGCNELSKLPEELWSLTTLLKVIVVLPTHQLANHLQNVEIKNGCELIISGPSNDVIDDTPDACVIS